MSQSHTGGYWGPRSESVEKCAAQLAQLLGILADIDPLLSGWRDKVLTEADAAATPPIAGEADIIERLLADRVRTEDNSQIIEDLGYSSVLWNCQADRRSAATLSVGLAATAAGVSNRVVLRLPDSSAAPTAYTPANAGAIVRALVEIFSPEEAVWTNDEAVKPQQEPDRILESGEYVFGSLIGMPAGWATYLADAHQRQFDGGLLPAEARVTRIGAGTLVTLGDDPGNPPIDSVLAVRRAMENGIHTDTQGEGGRPASMTTPGEQTSAKLTEHRKAVDAEPTGAEAKDRDTAD